MSRARKPEKTSRSASNVAGSSDISERRPGFRAVGDSASRLTGPIVARHQGGLVVRLKTEWMAIAGRDLGAVTWPEALLRDVLKLRVVPARALELQHRAPLLIERINLFFGRAAVKRLVFVQGILPVAALTKVSPPSIPEPDAAALTGQVAGVADPELRAALAALGRAVIGATRRAS